MNILITGGSGYLGSVLTPWFLEDGYQVTVLDNLMYKQQSLLECCRNKKFNFIYGDVRNEELFKSLISKHDVIFHLAAYVGMPVCNKFPNEAIQVNYNSSKTLAENISNDQLIVYPTTNSGYGVGVFLDGKPGFCTEETPMRPISLYGETKRDAENILMNTQRCISLRLATVFGVSRRMRLDLLVNDFVWRAFNDKFIVLFESHFLRNFIHVNDVAKTFTFCLFNHDKMKNQIYNVGNSDLNMSKLDLCNRIKNHIHDFCVMESPINKDPDQRNYIVSSEKIKKLGWWDCKYDLDYGIQELLKAYPILKNSVNIFSNV